MEGVGSEHLGVRRSEQIGRQDERAESIVCRGGEDGGAIWRPLSTLEMVPLILRLRPSGGFRV